MPGPGQGLPWIASPTRSQTDTPGYPSDFAGLRRSIGLQREGRHGGALGTSSWRVGGMTMARRAKA